MSMPISHTNRLKVEESPGAPRVVPTFDIIRTLSEKQVIHALISLRIIFLDSAEDVRQMALEKGKHPSLVAQCIGYFLHHNTEVRIQAMETLSSILEVSQPSRVYFEDYASVDFFSQVVSYATSSSENLRVSSCGLLRTLLTTNLTYFGPRLFDLDTFCPDVLSSLKRYQDPYTLESYARFVLYYGLIKLDSIEMEYISTYVAPTITCLTKHFHPGFSTVILDLAELCIDAARDNDTNETTLTDMTEIPTLLIKANVPKTLLASVSILSERKNAIASIIATCFANNGVDFLQSLSLEELLSGLAPLIASFDATEHVHALISIAVSALREYIATMSGNQQHNLVLPAYFSFVIVDTLRNAKVTMVVQAALDLLLVHLPHSNPWEIRMFLSMGIVPALVRLFSHPEPTIHVGAIIALRNCVSVCVQTDKRLLNLITTNKSAKSEELSIKSSNRLRAARVFASEVADDVITSLSLCGGYDLLNSLYLKNESGQAMSSGRALSRMIEDQIRHTLPPLSAVSSNHATVTQFDHKLVSRVLAHVQTIPKALLFETVQKKYPFLKTVAIYATTLRVFNRARVLYSLQQLCRLHAINPRTTEKYLVLGGHVHTIVTLYSCTDVMIRAQALVLLMKLLVKSRDSTAPIPEEVIEKVMSANGNQEAIEDAGSGKVFEKLLSPQLIVAAPSTVSTKNSSSTQRNPVKTTETKRSTAKRGTHALIDWSKLAYPLFSITAAALQDKRSSIDKLSALFLLEIFRWLRVRAAKRGKSASLALAAVPENLLAVLYRQEIRFVIQDRTMNQQEQDEEEVEIKKHMEKVKQMIQDGDLTTQNVPIFRQRDAPVDEKTRDIFIQLENCIILTRKLHLLELSA